MTAEALAQLHAVCFTRPPPWSAADFASFLNDPAHLLYLRSEHGALMGFALFRVVVGEAELLTLAVHPEARRAGLARDLLRDGLTAAKTRGAEMCFLEVAEDNHAALALYERAGFTPQGRRKGYYSAPGDASVDALILRKLLA